ncbi:MAG: hypothetical protein WC548_02255 [Candidatus Pacearchaeota archaeon]
MNTKKSARIFLLFVFGLLFVGLMSGAWAAYVDPDTGVMISDEERVDITGSTDNTDVWASFKIFLDNSGIGGFFKIFFSSNSPLGGELLTRIFMAILLAMFVYTAFDVFFSGQSKYIHWGATIAATALAVIWLPGNFLEAIRVGYGAMGATILSVIPFLIIFWFSIKIQSLSVARATWIFYSFYYFALYVSTIMELKGKGGFPYFIAFIVGLIIFIFMKSFRRWLFKGKIEGIGEEIDKGIKVQKLYRKAARESDQVIANDLRRQARDLEDSI